MSHTEECKTACRNGRLRDEAPTAGTAGVDNVSPINLEGDGPFCPQALPKPCRQRKPAAWPRYLGLAAAAIPVTLLQLQMLVDSIHLCLELSHFTPIQPVARKTVVEPLHA